MAADRSRPAVIEEGYSRLAGELREKHFQLSQKVVQLETLYEAGLSLSHSLQTESVIGEFLQLAVGMVDARGGFLFLKEERRGRLALVQHANLDQAQVRVLGRPAVRSRLGRGIRARRPLHLAPGTLPSSLEKAHLLVVPIGDLGFIGVMDKESRQGVQAFGEEDAHLLELMGQQAGAALANARLYREILEEKNLTQNVLASIGSGVISTDLRGRIVQVNPAVERLLGGEGRLRGKSCVRLFQRQGCKGLAQAVAACLRDGKSRQLDGERLGEGDVVLNGRLNPLRNPQGKVEGLVIALENLTAETRIRTMFKQYASDQVVDLLLASKSGPALGGEKREATVLFVDLRGSTALLEQIGAEEMVAVLNDCFTRLVEVVLRYQGTLDKYTGDGFMVVYGAPVAFPDDSERAARTALEIRAAMGRFNRARRLGLGLGIGICRGTVLAGNIGALRRMEYTAIGPKVNLASRLCDRARAGQIWTDQQVYEAVKGKFSFTPLGRHSFKGTGEPVEVYELLGARGARPRRGGLLELRAEEQGRQVNLSIPMAPQMEVAVSKAAAAMAEFAGLDEEKIEELKLALIEACINAFEHSRSKDHRLDLHFTIGEEELRILIADRGQGFDLERTRREQRERRARGERRRGWGLTIMEELMDEVEVRSDENGTTIAMVKRR
jgi:class 3 adenylate cyclase/anti-sigma regulatory factor (Ser/Thr protein kinase)